MSKTKSSTKPAAEQAEEAPLPPKAVAAYHTLLEYLVMWKCGGLDARRYLHKVARRLARLKDPAHMKVRTLSRIADDLDAINSKLYSHSEHKPAAAGGER